MPPTSSAVATWELGLYLKEAREVAGFKGVEAAKQLSLSQNFLSDVEHGRRKLSEDKIVKAGDAYGIPKKEMNSLFALRERADQRAWWTDFSGIFESEILRYFGLEYGAESVRTHESLIIPGLLQTEAYAHAIVTSDRPNTRTSEASKRVRVRQLRQRRLTDDDPLHLTAVISEAALKQLVGGSTVLAEQLRHLLDLIEKCPETLCLHVLPFSSGSHGALGASTFHLLSFAEHQLPDLGWQETVTSWGLIENPTRVNQYSQTYAESLAQAEDRAGSIELIEGALKDIT
ncbi:helix-turn-helix domain-containing protein [Parasphingorhabdus pacifica]